MAPVESFRNWLGNVESSYTMTLSRSKYTPITLQMALDGDDGGAGAVSVGSAVRAAVGIVRARTCVRRRAGAATGGPAARQPRRQRRRPLIRGEV